MRGRFLMLNGGVMRPFEVELLEGTLRREPCESASNILAPGFVDVHIHGAFGLDFMSATRPQMLELADRLGACGYEHFYPTTVSASAEAVLRAMGNLPDDPRMPGFHLEGPFISPAYPGAQPPEAITRPPAPGSEWDAVLNHPKLKRITLAPELEGALDLIRRLSERGVRVSMGHTNATYAQARAGFEAGARGATHCFNAMRGLHHREPGVLGFALDEPEVAAELIYDRLHVSRAAASILFKCKGKDGVIAVSDGTMASGQPEGTTLQMWGHRAETRAGGVYLSGTDTLAGSAITLLDAFRCLAEDFGAAVAVAACCVNPCIAMGLEIEPRTWLEFGGDYRLIRTCQA